MKKKYLTFLFFVIFLAMLALLSSIIKNSTIFQSESNDEKYGGHGFDYMHGYSSTDFTDYHVYDSDKLFLLDHPVDLLIENEEDMPVLDGAEACYLVYCAIAKTVYKDIDKIEEYWKENAENYWESARNGKADYNEELFNIYQYNGKIVGISFV